MERRICYWGCKRATASKKAYSIIPDSFCYVKLFFHFFFIFFLNENHSQNEAPKKGHLSYVKKVWHTSCKAKNENDSQNDKMIMIFIIKMAKLKKNENHSQKDMVLLSNSKTLEHVSNGLLNGFKAQNLELGVRWIVLNDTVSILISKHCEVIFCA